MCTGNDPARIVARLRALLHDGKTIRGAAEALGQKKSRVHQIAVRHRLPRRRRYLKPAKRRSLERHIRAAKLTLSEIARRLKVAKATVSAHREKYLLQGLVLPKLARRIKRPRRCDNGHLVNHWPCLQCTAIEEAKRGKP